MTTLDLEQFLGKDNILNIEVVSPVKTEQIACIDHIKFRNALREKGIIPYGEDLEDDIQTLLWLSSNREDLIMLRKLKKWLGDIKKFQYFNYFGMYFREEINADSDFENEDDKANLTVDKLIKLATRRNKKHLAENHKSEFTSIYLVGSSDSFDTEFLEIEINPIDSKNEKKNRTDIPSDYEEKKKPMK